MNKLLLMISILLVSVNTYTQTYNPSKAIEYAEKWWNKTETGYVDYEEMGGNCAAFVSQCLRAGGLDLSKGTNGNGGYVKPDKVIAGVEALITHLKKYQDVEFKSTSTGPNDKEPEFVVPGDPVFYGLDYLNPYQHSMFCVKDSSSQRIRLYNAGTDDHYHKRKAEWAPYTYNYYFHIKSSIPEHCRNCIKDADEIDVDCGGSCPPCGDAPRNKSITSSSQLENNNYAMESITVQNTSIEAGRSVEFISMNNIAFGNGFEVKNGAQMQAKTTSDVLKISRDHSQECIPIYLNYFTQSQPFFLNLVGYTYFDVAIYQSIRGMVQLIYKKTNQLITKNGSVALWNANDGVDRTAFTASNMCQFYVEFKLTASSGRTLSNGYWIVKVY